MAKFKFKVGDTVKIKKSDAAAMPKEWIGSIGAIIEINDTKFGYHIEWQVKVPLNADPIEAFNEDELIPFNSTLIKQRLGIK